MNVLEELASAKGRRDEQPNVLLARRLAAAKDSRSIAALVGALERGPAAVQSDAMKVLYEAGEREPSLIAPYAGKFAALLQHRNNRLVWGAMAALDAIASGRAEDVHPFLREILAAAETGSVITRDHAVGILTRLCGVKKHRPVAFAELTKLLKKCPVNQLPMYAEMSAASATGKDRAVLKRLLQLRMNDLEKDSQIKRLKRVLKLLANGKPSHAEGKRS